MCHVCMEFIGRITMILVDFTLSQVIHSMLK